MKEHPKGTCLSAQAFAEYTMARGGAMVDTTGVPDIIAVFRPDRTPERWRRIQQGRDNVLTSGCGTRAASTQGGLHEQRRPHPCRSSPTAVNLNYAQSSYSLGQG